MTDCPRYRHDLGAYVLHGLDADEARAVEAHLETCPACRAEQAELAALPPLLDLARDVPPPVPARVRDRVIADAVRRRARRRWAAVAAAAALVAAVLGALVGTQLAPAPAPVTAVPLQAAEPFEAAGWATFRTLDDTVVVELELAGLEPLDEPAIYEGWLSTHDDRVLSIGQLEAGPEGSVSVTLTAGGPLETYRGFWITAEPDRRDPAHDGPTVLRAPVPPPR